MSIYRRLSDSMIAAYAPITAHLWRNVRFQQYGCRSHALQGMADESVNNGGALFGGGTTSWTTAGTLRIYIPEWCAGENGTRVIIRAKIKRTVDEGLGHPVYVRLKYNTETSNEESWNSSSWHWVQLELDISEDVGGNIISIDVEGKSDDINSTLNFVWSRAAAGSLVEAL